MKRLWILMIITVSLLAACVVAPNGQRGYGSGGVVIAPLLPRVVVLDAEPYYFYSNFHYHYTNDRWYYSKSRRGPWAELPRDHYPKEVRYKGHAGKQHRDRDDDQRGRDRNHDNRNQDY
jgi:hypothetical protein